MLTGFDDSAMYESIASGEWLDTSQVHSAQDQWYLLAKAYKNAADQIIVGLPEALLLGQHSVYIASPVMFLYRHYLELEIKAIWLDLRDFGHILNLRDLGEQTMLGNSSKPHSLLPVWRSVRNILFEINEEVSTDKIGKIEAEKIYDAMEERIKEFNRIDERSMNFRYPIDKTGKNRILASLPDGRQLSHVKDVIEVVAGYFNSIRTWMHEERNFHIEMQYELRDMENEMWGNLDYP